MGLSDSDLDRLKKAIVKSVTDNIWALVKPLEKYINKALIDIRACQEGIVEFERRLKVVETQEARLKTTEARVKILEDDIAWLLRKEIRESAQKGEPPIHSPWSHPTKSVRVDDDGNRFTYVDGEWVDGGDAG